MRKGILPNILGGLVALVWVFPVYWMVNSALLPADKVRGKNPTWLPFGGGTRRCLGAALAMAELRVAIPEIARRFDLMADRPEPEAPQHRNVTMIPARGGRVVVVGKAG